MHASIQSVINFFTGVVFIYAVAFSLMFAVVFWPLVCYAVAYQLGLDPVMADYNCHTWNGICSIEEIKPTVLGRRGYYD